MLQAMREKVMGVMGWVVIGLIIVTFALFGLGSYLQDKSRAFAARVNDVEISQREFQQTYQQQRAQMEQMLGDAYDPALIDDTMLKRRALDILIEKQLVLQASQEAGMAISDQLLAARIHAIPAFQVDGTFSDTVYRDILLRQGRVAAEFEASVRSEMQTQQLVNGLSQTAFVTDEELARAYRLQDQKRDFSYMVVAADLFKASIEASDEQVQTYYDQHKAEFTVPERVRLSYLRLNGDLLGKTIEIDEDELLAHYEERKQSLLTQEQRRASHILIQVASDADSETVSKARTEAESLLQKIRAGEDFAELARQHSADPGSAAQGGDLGFFARGVMLPEFDEVVFSMETGAVSEPVKTQFGFHIIKLADVHGSEIPGLEDVRAELIKELKQRRIDDLFYEQLEVLTDTSYETPDSLDAAADVLALEVQTSDWITSSNGPGIGKYPKVRAAAFSEDVLESGNNSEAIEVGPVDAIVVRVEEREAAHPSPLEDVRDAIVGKLKLKLAAEQAKAKGDELLQKLAQGELLEALKDQDYFTYRNAEGVIRTAPGFDPEVVHEAFRLQQPEQGASRDKGIQLANGNYAVIHLTAVADADPAAMPENVKIRLTQGFENMRRTLQFSALVADLRARADIVIPEDTQ